MSGTYNENPYGTPPFNVIPPDPTNTHRQAAQQQWTQDDGTFQSAIWHSPYVQRGTTTRFSMQVSHVLDGAITTWTTGPVLTILDRYMQPALSTYFSLGTVTANPTGSNQFYCDVQIATLTELEYFNAKWTGTYEPKAGPPILDFQHSRGFKVYQPGKPSRHYFYNTNTFGAH